MKKELKHELLIGCGSDWTKRLATDKTTKFDNLITLDYNADHNPDIVWDLNDPNVLPPSLPDNFFDEIHAYEVLEHIGSQGDYKTFFRQFSEFWRVLKPGGHFLATFPSRNSVWAYGDPSHTRIMQVEQFFFLHQPNYDRVGKSSMSDFRNIYKADFDIIHTSDDEETVNIIMKAVKPSQIKEKTA
jgi:predicted SAM-dependent methyltransferase